ncbi:hypothetical protein ACJW31_03G008200 [Castanea mollissima]
MVVFLDYDGTLSPIVNDPDRAFMSNAMRSAVRKVGKHFPTAIVSGRSRDKVFQFVRINNIYYAGSHGMDISTPSVSLYYGNHKHQTRTIDEKGNEMVNFCPAQKFLPRIQTIKVMLQEITRGIKGAMVEDNKFCLSVHFRCVNEDNVGVLKEKVKSAMKCYKDFRISEGKEVMEIRPNINWDKGLALQYILDNLGFENSSKVLPIYIGDDKTDEDAFKMIKSIGRGFPIVVSSTPKETEALYSLRDPIEFSYPSIPSVFKCVYIYIYMESITVWHVAVIPFPCQGHINTMMGVCKSLSSKQGHGILITFVVTEEWLNCICGSDPNKPDDNSNNTICFATIPNVVKLEKMGDFGPFNEVVKAKMEAPIEELLD